MSVTGSQKHLTTGCASTRGSYRFNWSELKPGSTQQRMPTLLECLVTSISGYQWLKSVIGIPADASLLDEYRERQSSC